MVHTWGRAREGSWRNLELVTLGSTGVLDFWSSGLWPAVAALLRILKRKIQKGLYKQWPIHCLSQPLGWRSATC